jgi:hypothetical protein
LQNPLFSLIYANFFDCRRNKRGPWVAWIFNMATLHATLGHAIPLSSAATGTIHGEPNSKATRSLLRYLHQRKREWKQTLVGASLAFAAISLWLRFIV